MSIDMIKMFTEAVDTRGTEEVPRFDPPLIDDGVGVNHELIGDENIPRFADAETLTDTAESESMDQTDNKSTVESFMRFSGSEAVRETSPLVEAPLQVRSCYVNAEGLTKNLPRSDGEWKGEPGNSVWMPDPDYIPQKGNPEGKTWKEILDKYDIDGIPFNDGEPDFSEIAEAEVQVDEISEDRDDNFAKADEALAEQWTEEQKDGHNWTADEVRNYRKENRLTWHECGDRKTMQLVPAEVHSNVPHSGGVSAAKAESTESNDNSTKA